LRGFAAYRSAHALYPRPWDESVLTYCAPLFVTAEFTNHSTGEIKSQTVFMGDFPMMTPKGTFIINGTERVVVSQHPGGDGDHDGGADHG
jgi:DNA-directed RNA polymerase beta subunit